MKILLSIFLTIGTVSLTLVLGILFIVSAVLAVGWLATWVSPSKPRNEDSVS